MHNKCLFKNKYLVGMLVFLAILLIILMIPIFNNRMKVIDQETVKNTSSKDLSYSVIDTSSYFGSWRQEDKKTHIIQTQKEAMLLTNAIKSDSVADELKQKFSMIDYSTHTLIAVFLGMRPVGEYGLEPVNVYETGEKIIVNVKEIIPGNSCFTTDIVTYPNALIVIPKTEKMVETVFSSEVKECK